MAVSVSVSVERGVSITDRRVGDSTVGALLVPEPLCLTDIDSSVRGLKK